MSFQEQSPNYLVLAIAGLFGIVVLIIAYYIIVTNTNDTPTTTTKLVQSQLNNANIPVHPDGDMSVPVPTLSKTNVTKPSKNEVYLVDSSVFTYDDSEAVCKYMNAEVATLDQLTDAWNKGADWCSVGWTKDGIPAFPIQQATWEKINANRRIRGSCGNKAGVNTAPDHKENLYGVLCYGPKREPIGQEKVKTHILSDHELSLEAKMAELAPVMEDARIAPFNSDRWRH